MNARVELPSPGPCRDASIAVHGWRARLALGFARRGDATRMVCCRHEGPLLVQRPFYPEGRDCCHVYLLHPPAGIVGGDALEIDVEVDDGAGVLLTTPAATRFYRSGGATASCRQRLRVGAGAALEWLPQETIVYDGARLTAETRIELAAGARFAGWEVIGLGRPAAGERFAAGRLDFRLSVLREGRPLLLDRLVLNGGDPLLAAGPGLQGQTVTATLIAAPADAGMLAVARDAVPAKAGAGCGLSCVDGLLIGRVLAAGAGEARAVCERIWAAIRPPLLGRPACAPRIWRT